MKKQTKTSIFMAIILLYTVFFAFSGGLLKAQTGTDEVGFADPISVDSLYVLPGTIYEGDTIVLIAGTTHSSSPCGLVDYSVLYSGGNIIYVDAKYWQGMLTALCQTTDKFIMHPLSPGKYVLNFMNLAKLEFIVYPKINRCFADFSYVFPKCNDSKCINTVQFNDQSSGNIKSWFWDFGDSTFSTLQNPSHTYKTAGVYNVCLSLNTLSTGIADCTDKTCKTVALGTCNAKFDYKIIELPTAIPKDSAFAPFPLFLVKFTDLSADSVKTWFWNFGDGTYSEDQHPSHVYRTGKYVVDLRIYTVTGCTSTYTDTLVINNSIPVCQFPGTVKDYSGTDGCKFIIELDNGLKIQPFLADSSFTLYHNQRVMIDYTPIRIATTCMMGIPARITCIREIIQPYCRASFVWNWDKTCKVYGYCIKFADKSEGMVNSWFWDFGDGTTSTDQNPNHHYPISTIPNIFNVCLTIKTLDGCTSSYCDTVIISDSAPWVPVIGGEENHNIVIPATIQDLNPEYGDYIGLFFRNYSGNLVCGGMARWENKNVVLTAWQNTCYFDSMVYPANSIYPICRKNGFDVNEKFEFKIWKHRTNEEILIRNAEYKISKLFPDSGLFKADGLSYVNSLQTCARQNIKVHNGWNLLSLNIEPENSGMSAIFGNHKVIVKNYRGEIVYFPNLNIYEGVWSKYEGYKVKAFEDFTLSVQGEIIPPQTTIPLPGIKLPYFLPYYYAMPLSIEKMMVFIKDNIRYVQSIEYVNGIKHALNYIPKYGINQIKYMKPGLGYKLSLYDAMRSFTYPSISDSTVVINVENSLTSNLLLPETENNRILIIPAFNFPFTPGNYITATTTDGTIVGEELLTSGNNALTLWDLESGVSYDTIILYYSGNNNDAGFKISLSGNTVKDGDLYVLQKTTDVPSVVSGKLNVNAYPILVENELNLAITLEKSSDVEIRIINLLGKTMFLQDAQILPEGATTLSIDLENLKPGSYIYQVKTKSQMVNGRIQVVK